MKTLLAIIMACLIAACAAPQLPPPSPPVAPCEPKTIAGEVVHVGPHVLVFAEVDQDCDGECDGMIVAHYIGMFNGKPEFELLGYVSCEEGRIYLLQAKAQAKKFGAKI